MAHRAHDSISIRPSRTYPIGHVTDALIRSAPFALAKWFVSSRLRARAEYAKWTIKYDTLLDDDLGAIRERVRSLPYCPMISAVMPVFNTPAPWLRRAIESIQQQLYPNWELCIADDASTASDLRSILEHYAAEDPRIKVAFRRQSGHISRTTNSALDLVTGQFTALVDHDDELPPHAFYMVAEELNAHPDADLVYSDEDKIDEYGRRYGPYFKSDWNPDLFLSHNMISHLGVYRTELVRELGGFREGYEGSQDYDLALRVIEQTTPDRIRHIPYVLYHWRAVPGSAARGSSEKSYAITAARNAIGDHLLRRQIRAEVTSAAIPIFHRVRYKLANQRIKLSIIVQGDDVPARADWVRDLSKDNEHCEFEVLVAGRDGLRSDERFDPRLPSGDLRSGRLSNRAARVATGEVLAFLDGNLEIVTPSWAEEMVSLALRPEVGAVGARIFYPNGRVFHAGIVIGVGGIAARAHDGFGARRKGSVGRALLQQNFSAVSGACLVARRDVFEQIGGFDETLPAPYADIDLCLRIRRRGYLICWTPYAKFRYRQLPKHRELLCKMAHGKRASGDVPLKLAGEEFPNGDPYYSPNLSLDNADYSLAFPPRLQRPWLPIHVRPGKPIGPR
jgi:glycosyltransferase involved in cell wall biosynthesis